MTRPLSDSQLDAQAAAPRHERDLDSTLALHRLLCRDDRYIPKLTAETPPVSTNPQTAERRAGPMSMLGPTLSGRLESFVSYHIEEGETVSTPGPLSPWHSAFFYQRVECRRSHPAHWERTEWRGSLCSSLVNLTVRAEPVYTLEQACLQLGLTLPRSQRTLLNALLWIEAEMDRQQQRQREKQREPYQAWAPPEESHERHDQPGLHRAECPKCQRHAA